MLKPASIAQSAVLIPLAVVTTLTAMAMSAVAAWDRGGTVADRTLLIALAVTICAGTHFLPALSPRRVTWLLWSACLLGTVYGHLTFFTHAAIRAGAERAQQSAQVTDATRQIDAAREALAGIKARPVAVVAKALAYTKSDRRRIALQAELGEAERAARLRDALVTDAAAVSASRVAVSDDPVISRLAAVTGSNEAGISLGVGILFAVILELMGASLWYEALRQGDEAVTAAPSSPVAQDPVAELRQAVEAGQCKPTVASIRAFLGCGQTRAIEMRRALSA